MMPMLARGADLDRVATYLTDDWLLQPKIDGHRLIIEVDGTGGVAGYNRNGARTIVPRAVTTVLQRLTAPMTFDGELLADTVILFDLVEGPGGVTTDLPCGERVKVLEILVTALGTNLVYRYDSTPAHNLLGTFGNAFWGNTHGIEISPHNGHIYVVDGVTAQLHEFDPITFAELNPTVLSPAPGDKIVDIAFRPAGEPTPAANTTWGRIKSLRR